MTASTENPNLEATNNYSNVAECKVNIQKSIVSLYANNKQVEFEIKTMPLILACKKKILTFTSGKIYTGSI